MPQVFLKFSRLSIINELELVNVATTRFVSLSMLLPSINKQTKEMAESDTIEYNMLNLAIQ
uniref:Uncharacterized protein n=1 Tax=Prevotella sp. GTC17262 TaxID=3236797 RepID=A0AB33JJ74_9BACT